MNSKDVIGALIAGLVIVAVAVLITGCEQRNISRDKATRLACISKAHSAADARLCSVHFS